MHPLLTRKNRAYTINIPFGAQFDVPGSGHGDLVMLTVPRIALAIAGASALLSGAY